MDRFVLGLMALLVAATPALAANKLGDARAAFPMLANYLKLPSAERSRFAPAYYFKAAGQPLAAPVWMILDGKRTPFPIDANGRVGRLPTPAELDRGKLEIGVDATAKIQISLSVEPLVPPSADLDAQELAEAIAQAATGSRKAAGLLALAVPRLDDVVFVGAGSGEIEFADGHKAALPIVKGQPIYTPSAQPGARRIRLARTPTKLDID
ncbi:MAG: hypothetical protein JSR98_01455 [Proteobacteria bacterium]|nr:hypothetical protein [Pseudomonadota bacterium]